MTCFLLNIALNLPTLLITPIFMNVAKVNQQAGNDDTEKSLDWFYNNLNVKT